MHTSHNKLIIKHDTFFLRRLKAYMNVGNFLHASSSAATFMCTHKYTHTFMNVMIIIFFLINVCKISNFNRINPPSQFTFLKKDTINWNNCSHPHSH